MAEVEEVPREFVEAKLVSVVDVKNLSEFAIPVCHSSLPFQVGQTITIVLLRRSM